MALNRTQRAAMEASDLGWSVIPIAPKTKGKPLVKWKRYQAERPSSHDLMKWFQNPSVNMAVITGEVSDGLVIVDCDNSAPSGDWAETVISKSGRTAGLGYHFFYRSSERIKTRKFRWGEIRGEGGYTVMPPSIHPSGNPYTWYLSPAEVEVGVLPRDLAVEATRSPSPMSEGREPRSTITNSSNSLDTVALPPEGSWPSYYCDPDTVLRVVKTMGISTSALMENFSCILPGHEECNPSATLCPNWRGFIVYFDNHQRDRRLVYTLPEVRASLAYGRPVNLSGPETSVWGIRALVEAGIMEPVRIDAPQLEDASLATKTVYDGFLHLLACKWHIDHGAPTVFARPFAGAWCGVSPKQARLAISVLIDKKLITSVGTYKGSNLYLPTIHALDVL